jgi:hypothetical protein
MYYIKNQSAKTRDSRRAFAQSTLAAAVGAAVGGGVAGTALAAFPDGTVLNFDPGMEIVTGCTSGNYTGTSCTLGGTPYTAFEITDMGGSYFSMDQGGNPGPDPSEKTPLSQFNGIIIGSVQPASGSHTGLPDGTESPNIDEPWGFFNNTGMHQTSIAITELSDLGATKTLDFSGWAVIWGEFGPGQPNDPISMPGTATIACSPDPSCPNNSDYTLDMDVHVPVAFGSVPYSLHLEGAVSLPGAPPVAVDDSGTTIAGNSIAVDVLANDSVGSEGFDPDSVTVSTPPANGTTDDTSPDGDITYTPNTGPDFVGTDTFQYTVASTLGFVSAPATVTVDVQENVAPVANDDALDVSTSVLAGAPPQVNVLANDTDVNNAPGLPGGIDAATVTVVQQPATGTCQANPDGTITYTQPAPAVGGQFSCTYQVSDVDSFNPPLQSNVATLNINVTATTSDWPVALDPTIIPTLVYNPGVPGDDVDLSVPPPEGSKSSYFTMQVTPTTLIYTVLKPGPDGGVVIGHDQPAGNTHTGAPTGDEEVSVDEPWKFFANTGLHLSKNGGVTGNPDGTLQFGNRDTGEGQWIVSWNGIPEINLGGDPTGTFPEDLGFGTITCDPAPCADQSTFILDYEAHVPPGDPSGFGGVPYTLRLEGVVRFLDGSLKTSNGTVTSATRLLAGNVAESDPDSEVTIQCAGDCFDYTIEEVTESRVSVVLPLAGGVPLNPVWRILDNGAWRSFDTSAGDSIRSAPFASDATECPDPGDASYGELTTGHQCIELAIADNGLNDLDPAVGIIRDPSGMGSGGTAGGGGEFVDTRGSDTSGCSILSDRAGPLRGGEWWLLTGFLAWLGWRSRPHRR